MYLKTRRKIACKVPAFPKTTINQRPFQILSWAVLVYLHTLEMSKNMTVIDFIAALQEKAKTRMVTGIVGLSEMSVKCPLKGEQMSKKANFYSRSIFSDDIFEVFREVLVIAGKGKIK